MDYMQWALPIILGRAFKTRPEPQEPSKEQEQKASECKSYIMQDNNSPECSGLSMECNTYE